MNWRWFISKSVREASAVHKQVRKLLDAQRDILSPPAISALEEAIVSANGVIRGPAEAETLKKQMASMEAVANKWLKPYPNSVIRENIEVLLVALAIALGIRTFFLQPFKIPTGSMQPTLLGVTPGPQSEGARNQPDLQIPNSIARFVDYWIHGDSYYNIVAPTDGRLEALKPPVHFLLFNLKQDYQFAGKWHSIWFPADELFARVGLHTDEAGNFVNAHSYRAGEVILRLKTTAGDHLFVDRLSYNFRHPKRGEIVVFATAGIPEPKRDRWRIPGDQFYIKRLVGLGGEKIQIGDDHHLIVDGKRLDTNTPHFQNVYGFSTNDTPRESHYTGHLNGIYAPLFPNDETVYSIPPKHYLLMGDNTMSSLDSRYWGDIPEQSVVGKYFFVYWPFSKRFGWSVQ